jgi:hypothetical protein
MARARVRSGRQITCEGETPINRMSGNDGTYKISRKEETKKGTNNNKLT